MQRRVPALLSQVFPVSLRTGHIFLLHCIGTVGRPLVKPCQGKKIPCGRRFHVGCNVTRHACRSYGNSASPQITQRACVFPHYAPVAH